MLLQGHIARSSPVGGRDILVSDMSTTTSIGGGESATGLLEIVLKDPAKKASSGCTILVSLSA